MSEETNQETVENLTPEQLEQRRTNLVKYYEKQVYVLKAQLAYETMLADIEEQRVKRMTMIMRQAQMAAPQQEEEEEEEPTPVPEPNAEEPAKERKLKKA
jgi:hypothetical protein